MQLVRREEALAHCGMFMDSPLRVLLVEARAGQGKTVLASQLADTCGLPVAWCSCTRTDTDPARLYLKLLDQLSQAAPSIDNARAASALYQRLTADELPLVAGSALNKAFQESNSGILTIIDDAHLLASSPSSLKMLQAAIANTPASFKFAILSRWPLTIEEGPLVPPAQSFNLDNDLLAFSRAETASLLNDVLGIPATSQVISQLVDSTGGWVAALRLAARDSIVMGDAPDNITGSLRELILRHSLNGLSATTRQEMLQASLLPEVPANLAQVLLSRETRQHLGQMAKTNFFVRIAHSEGNSSYVIHHLLRDALRKTASQELPTQASQHFLAQTADWFLKEGYIEDALDSAAQAGAHQVLQTILHQTGMELIASNRVKVLQDTLGRIPKETVLGHGWMSFFYGTSLYDSSPPDSLPYLQRAVELFQQSGDEHGELLGLTRLINFHLMVDGRFGRLGHLVRRAESIYKQLKDSLPLLNRLFCAQSLAMGTIHYLAQPDRGLELFREAEALCRQNRLHGFNAEVLMALAIGCGLRGDMPTALNAMEPAFALINDHTVSPATRCGVEFMHLNYAAMHGRFDIYNVLRERLFARHGIILNNSYLGPFVVIWDLDKLVAQNKLEEAIAMATGAIESLPAEGNQHLTSQYLHYKALACALAGNTHEALSAINKSLRQRAYAGGKYFRGLNLFLLGTALWQCGNPKSALRSISKSIKISESFGEIAHRAGAHLYRALIHHEMDHEEAMAEDLRQGLTLMRSVGNKYFFGWNAPLVLKALSLAVAKEIHVDFARMLAETRLGHTLLDNGAIQPLYLLDDLSGLTLIAPNGATFAPTGLQKKLLENLASAPANALEADEIMLGLWPDTHKARPKFDTLLSRLRSAIKKELGKEAAQILQLKGGVLRLQYVRSHTARIASFANEGLAHARAGKHLAAHRALLGMDQVLLTSQASLPVSQCSSESYRELIARAYGRWADLLHIHHFHTYALDAVETSLKIEPISDRNQRLKHNLLARLGRPGEASLSLKRYKRILLDEGFEEDEANEAIETLLN